ncbi:MAG: sodium/solute symporter [Acidobacteriaceae bacterium]|nr:sodium/solute symporter [Acidobacteriaceae bacterium]
MLSLGFAGFVIPLYFAATIAIGWFTRRKGTSANSYLNASRSLSVAVVSIAYLSANSGALEIIGMSALAAQYGVRAFHFYWIGAIPAMIFLAMWMMPVYRRSGVNSVPEYLDVRYGPSVRLMNACVLALTALLMAGICQYAMAQVLGAVLGLSFLASVLVSSSVVLVYVLLGGVRATIYNEVFQLIVMLAGLVPLTIRTAHLAIRPSTASGEWHHLWLNMPLMSPGASLDGIGVVLGLGFVLSFSYWCTDFVQMQRAFAARTDDGARQVPLWAGFGKLVISLIVVIPGLAAFHQIQGLGHSQRFDQVMPLMMTAFYSPAMLSLGFTALVASLMAGLASRISAFAALWTEDIYAARFCPCRADSHYLLVGRISVIAAVAASAAASWTTFHFGSLMEHVQLISSIFVAPFWAIFLLGMTTQRITKRGAIAGFVSGCCAGILHLAAVEQGWLCYGSAMSTNFYVAIYTFTIAVAVAWLFREKPSQVSDTCLVFHWRTGFQSRRRALLLTLSVLLLFTCLFLNWLWR